MLLWISKIFFNSIPEWLPDWGFYLFSLCDRLSNIRNSFLKFPRHVIESFWIDSVVPFQEVLLKKKRKSKKVSGMIPQFQSRKLFNRSKKDSSVSKYSWWICIYWHISVLFLSNSTYKLVCHSYDWLVAICCYRMTDDGVQTRAHLEAQLESSLALKSPHEYRQCLLSYIRILARYTTFLYFYFLILSFQ